MAGAKHRDLEATIDDPKMYTKPFTIKVTEILQADPACFYDSERPRRLPRCSTCGSLIHAERSNGGREYEYSVNTFAAAQRNRNQSGRSLDLETPNRREQSAALGRACVR